METVLLDFFSHSSKIQLLRKRKKIKKVKVWNWYKTNEPGEHVCLEKKALQLTLSTFDKSKRLVISESTSIFLHFFLPTTLYKL